MALKEAIKEQSYLRTIFNLISILGPLYSTRIYTDSQSAIALAKNPIYLPRTKHIDIQYYYIREALVNKLTELVFIPTSQQLADYLTKPGSIQGWPNFLENISLLRLD